MRRSPATIVILAWNAWESTEACLDSLWPTLGVRDQVVVVDNGSTDATARRLPHYPWVEVVTNAENHGFAGGCNDGAAVARHDILVFLNNDTVLSGRWLDPLVVPFDEDAGVGATGPRSNFVSGPQVAEGASYLRGDIAGMRRFARAWAQAHRGQTTVTERLVGFCLAVRRATFEQLGGSTPLRRWRLRGRRPLPAHREHRDSACSSPTSPSSTTRATRPSTPTASTGTPSRSRTGPASNRVRSRAVARAT